MKEHKSNSAAFGGASLWKQILLHQTGLVWFFISQNSSVKLLGMHWGLYYVSAGCWQSPRLMLPL